MATILRDRQYEMLYKRLVEERTGYCGEKVFRTYKELMIFAGMVGVHFGKKSVPVKKGEEIPQRVFENTQHDTYVYLTSLHDQKSTEIFRENNENECWKIFECYCNGGLDIINNWLLDAPGDTDGVETILNEMKKISAESLPETNNIDPMDVQF